MKILMSYTYKPIITCFRVLVFLSSNIPIILFHLKHCFTMNYIKKFKIKRMQFNTNLSAINDMATTTKSIRFFSGGSDEDIYSWIQEITFVANIL